MDNTVFILNASNIEFNQIQNQMLPRVNHDQLDENSINIIVYQNNEPILGLSFIKDSYNTFKLQHKISKISYLNQLIEKYAIALFYKEVKSEKIRFFTEGFELHSFKYKKENNKLYYNIINREIHKLQEYAENNFEIKER